MSTESTIRRNRMSLATQVRAANWVHENLEAIPNLTIKEIMALINAKVEVDQPLCEKNTRSLLKALGISWRANTKADDRVSRQAIYDKMLLLQGRIERQDEEISKLSEQVRTLSRDVSSLSDTWAPVGCGTVNCHN